MGSPSVELLYSTACPNSQEALKQVREVMTEEGITSELRITCVQTDEDAQKVRFLGSPTVRVDGRDVELEAEDRHDYALQCRLYTDGGRLTGVPPASLIRAALRRSLGG